LTSGDMLFYESSKVFHGRPYRFKGSWYSSVFAHYYPKFGWNETNHALENNYAIPPSWTQKSQHHFEIPLTMVNSGMKEASCPNDWCQSEHTIKREGRPVEHGKLIAPTGESFDFHPKHVESCKDLDVNCERWADTNECEQNPGFMLKTCKRACKACNSNDLVPTTTVKSSDGGPAIKKNQSNRRSSKTTLTRAQFCSLHRGTNSKVRNITGIFKLLSWLLRSQCL